MVSPTGRQHSTTTYPRNRQGICTGQSRPVPVWNLSSWGTVHESKCTTDKKKSTRQRERVWQSAPIEYSGPEMRSLSSQPERKFTFSPIRIGMMTRVGAAALLAWRSSSSLVEDEECANLFSDSLFVVRSTRLPSETKYSNQQKEMSFTLGLFNLRDSSIVEQEYVVADCWQWFQVFHCSVNLTKQQPPSQQQIQQPHPAKKTKAVFTQSRPRHGITCKLRDRSSSVCLAVFADVWCAIPKLALYY